MAQSVKRLVKRIQSYKNGLSYCRALRLLLWVFDCQSKEEFLTRFSEKDIYENFDKYFWKSSKVKINSDWFLNNPRSDADSRYVCQIISHFGD